MNIWLCVICNSLGSHAILFWGFNSNSYVALPSSINIVAIAQLCVRHSPSHMIVVVVECWTKGFGIASCNEAKVLLQQSHPTLKTKFVLPYFYLLLQFSPIHKGKAVGVERENDLHHWATRKEVRAKQNNEGWFLLIIHANVKCVFGSKNPGTRLLPLITLGVATLAQGQNS